MAGADKSIRLVAERQQKSYRFLRIFVVTLAVVLPLLLYFVGVATSNGAKSLWSLEPIRESIASGRILADPGTALFQQGLLISTVSSETHIAETVASYVLAGGILFACVFVLFYAVKGLLMLVNRRGDAFSEQQVLRRLRIFTPTSKILSSMSLTYGEVIQKSNNRQWVVASAGRSIVVQTSLKEPLPFMFITSAKNSVESREKIYIPKDRWLAEVVKDATSREHFHSYVLSPDSYRGVPSILNKSVVAVLVKQLENVDIIIENNQFTVVIDSASIKSDVDFDRYLDALESVIKGMRSTYFGGGGLYYPIRDRNVHLLREFLPTVVLVGLALVYGLVTFFIPEGPTVSDMLVVTTMLSWAYLWTFWRRSSRKKNFMKSAAPGGSL